MLLRPRQTSFVERTVAALRDRGDAVVMCFSRGRDNVGWRATDPNLGRPRVNRGHENKRRR